MALSTALVPAGILANATLSNEGRAEAQLHVEAEKARGFGKDMVAAVLESVARILPYAPRMRALIESWPGDLAGAGVIFRLNAGLHALARSGRNAALQAIYEDGQAGRIATPAIFDAAMREALAFQLQDLMQWMAGPTQTNEVARVAGFVGALLELSAPDSLPCEVLEFGSSAGLNLNFAHYSCRLGSTVSGPACSAVQIAPRWEGYSPPVAPLAIERTAGVDLSPPDIRSDADCERLHAYIWPGEQERTERLRAAIVLARVHPPKVTTGLASRWLARELASPQREGTRRVIIHSMVVQYMSREERAAVDAAIALASAAATPDRPLARIGMEWNADRSAVELCVTQWNGTTTGGKTVIAAHCHPYGEWFRWLGLERA